MFLLIWGQMLTLADGQTPVAGSARGSTSLRAGIYKIDITPPLSVPLGGYSMRKGPATGVRDPLNTVAVVFDDGQTRVAIVSLDVIQVKYQEGQRIYHAIEALTGIKSDHVILNASHTHGSPWLDTDSCYSREVAAKVAGAVYAALGDLQPVTLGYGRGEVGFNVNRRALGKNGKVTGDLDSGGVTDHRVKTLRIDRVGDSTIPLGVLFNLACHANVFRGENTEITADFPGEAKSFIERNFGPGTTALFLQGCAGDIRANLQGAVHQYRNGDESDMMWCGWSAGSEVVKTSVWLGIREQVFLRQEDNNLRAVSRVLKVSARERGGEVLWPREHIVNGKAHLPVKMISIGQVCFVALPGEPVVEYGLKIESRLQGLGFSHVIVLGYSDGDAGYIPTEKMYKEGGYEVTESSLLPSCEEEIMSGIMDMAQELLAQER